jgi:putative membrane protein
MRSTTRTATRIGLAVTLAGASFGLIAVGATHASAATSQRAATSAQDQAFVTSNAQSNLAEISLGQLGEARAGDAKTKALAEVTLRDHETLEAGLTKVAKAEGLTMPTSPNAMQLQTAATLKATPAAAFDGAYAHAEVMGHQLAIAAANTETTAGSNASVIAYAKSYIPIATMHLQMAEAEVAALSGTAPTSVSAGTGGGAQTDIGAGDVWIVGVAGGVVIAAGAGSVELRRRRNGRVSTN